MLARLLLMVLLATAMFASRAPVELTDNHEAVSLVDALAATVVAAQAIVPVQPAQVTSALPPPNDLAPPSPDLGRVFRPPRASSS